LFIYLLHLRLFIVFRKGNKKAKKETLEHRRGMPCLRFAKKNAKINLCTEIIFPKIHSPSRDRLSRIVSEPVPILSLIRCLPSMYEKTYVRFITDKINRMFSSFFRWYWWYPSFIFVWFFSFLPLSINYLLNFFNANFISLFI